MKAIKVILHIFDGLGNELFILTEVQQLFNYRTDKTT
jgi:hypothetical protein